MILMLLGVLCTLGSAEPTAATPVAPPPSPELQRAQQALTEAETHLTTRWSAADEATKCKAAEMLLRHRQEAWQTGTIVRAAGHENDEAQDEKHYDMADKSWDSWSLKREAIQELAAGIASDASPDAVVDTCKNAKLDKIQEGGRWQLNVIELRDVTKPSAEKPIEIKAEIVRHLDGLLGEHGTAHNAVGEVEQEIRREYDAKEEKKRADAAAATPPVTYVAPTEDERTALETTIKSEAVTKVQEQLKQLVRKLAVSDPKEQMIVFHQPKHTVDSRVVRRIVGNQIKEGKVDIPLIFVSGSAQAAATVVRDLIQECDVRDSLQKRDGTARATTRIVSVSGPHDETFSMPAHEENEEVISYDDYITYERANYDEKLREAIFVSLHGKTKLFVLGTGSMIVINQVLAFDGSRPFRPLECLNDKKNESGLQVIWQGRANPNSGLFDHTSDWKDSPDAVLPRTRELTALMTRVHVAFNARTSGTNMPADETVRTAAKDSIFAGSNDAERLANFPAFLDALRVEGDSLTAIADDQRTHLISEIEAIVQMRALLEHLDNAQATFVGLPGALATGVTSEIVDTLTKETKLYPLLASVSTKEEKNDAGEITQPLIYDLNARDTILGHLNRLYREKYAVFNGLYGETVGNDQLYKIQSEEERTQLNEKSAEEQTKFSEEWVRENTLENEWRAIETATLHEPVEAAEKKLNDAQEADRQALQQALDTARQHCDQEVAKLDNRHLLIKTTDNKYGPQALFALKRSVTLPESLTALFAFANQYFKPFKGANERFQYVGMEESSAKLVTGATAEVWEPKGLMSTVFSSVKTGDKTGVFQLVDAKAAAKGIWNLAAPKQFKCPEGFDHKNGGGETTTESGMSTGTVIAIVAASIVGVAALGAGVYYGCA